jgi:hypothetical protein
LLENFPELEIPLAAVGKLFLPDDGGKIPHLLHSFE